MTTSLNIIVYHKDGVQCMPYATQIISIKDDKAFKPYVINLYADAYKLIT